VTPPAQALAAARDIADAAHRAGTAPLVADLNAVSPPTMTRIAEVWAGLPVVDGSISGPPPSTRPGARLYLSGSRAAEVAGLPWAGQVEPVVLAAGVGAASALKMCTASVYKGLNALVTQAMRTAGRHGVLDGVLADLARNDLDGSAGVAVAATKAHRFVDEMHEIAATQDEAGLTPALFEAFAAVYADIAATPLAEGDPESADRRLAPEEIVKRLAR
jgi:3-hydroxyisobutyrate dehydrogenase-like beta-hydroxyacid dehydrogenase